MTFVVREEKNDVRTDKATRLRVGILFEGSENGRQMKLLVYLPNQERGYGIATSYYGEVETDLADRHLKRIAP